MGVTCLCRLPRVRSCRGTQKVDQWLDQQREPTARPPMRTKRGFAPVPDAPNALDGQPDVGLIRDAVLIKLNLVGAPAEASG